MKLSVKTMLIVTCLFFVSVDMNAQCLADTSFALSTPQIVHDTCKGDANGVITVRINPLSTTSSSYSIFFNMAGPFVPTPSTSVPGTFEYQFTGLPANTYEAIVIDNNFCVDTIQAEVKEPDVAFSVTIDSIRHALCGNNGYLAATTDGGWSNPTVYTWTAYDDMGFILPGYPRTLGFQLAGLMGGDYSVSATDLRGCTATDNVTLIGGSTFEVDIDPPVDPTIDLGDSIDLAAYVNSGGNVTYQWFPTTFLENISANNDTVRSTPCSEINYIVLAIDASRGCSDADSITVHLTGEFEPFVPNIFNPYSADPRNSEFQAFGPGIEAVQMQVFDRKGAMVYQSPDSVKIGKWNGKIGGNGLEAVAGKYLYTLRINSICGETVSRTGGISLLR